MAKKETTKQEPTTEQLLKAVLEGLNQMMPLFSVINDGLAARDNKIARQVVETLKKQEEEKDKE